MTLPEAEILRITKPTITKFLRCQGYSNNTAQDIVYGSKNFGGLGWYDMEIEQGLQNLITFIQQFNAGGTIGQLSKAMIERWCWFIGFSPFCSEIQYQSTHHKLRTNFTPRK